MYALFRTKKIKIRVNAKIYVYFSSISKNIWKKKSVANYTFWQNMCANKYLSSNQNQKYVRWRVFLKPPFPANHKINSKKRTKFFSTDELLLFYFSPNLRTLFWSFFNFFFRLGKNKQTTVNRWETFLWSFFVLFVLFGAKQKKNNSKDLEK
jgi:hypothetical protein